MFFRILFYLLGALARRPTALTGAVFVTSLNANAAPGWALGLDLPGLFALQSGIAGVLRVMLFFIFGYLFLALSLGPSVFAYIGRVRYRTYMQCIVSERNPNII